MSAHKGSFLFFMRFSLTSIAHVRDGWQLVAHISKTRVLSLKAD